MNARPSPFALGCEGLTNPATPSAAHTGRCSAGGDAVRMRGDRRRHVIRCRSPCPGEAPFALPGSHRSRLPTLQPITLTRLAAGGPRWRRAGRESNRPSPVAWAQGASRVRGCSGPAGSRFEIVRDGTPSTSSLAWYDLPMAVKWRVDELAERKGWSARQLAEKAGVDIKTARNILTGKATRVDLETIGRLADALGVEPGALWRHSGKSRSDRWSAVAGVAGKASRAEMDWVLGRAGAEEPEPGLERAARGR